MNNSSNSLSLKKLGIAGLALSALALYLLSGDSATRPLSPKDMAKTSVKITNVKGNSGGSGVILSSSKDESFVLTNGHVCRVVENGGLVWTDNARHAVRNYRKSKNHDLCVISVAADLGVRTSLAAGAPNDYEKASIAGHPSLLPTVITEGHFSGREQIEILTGFRKCEEKDANSANVLFCLLLGGIPEITRYESQVVTATIKAGSSGSPVYNSKGEVSALVFAGSGDIGYAYTVPYEAISYFLEKELKTTETEFPKNAYELNLEEIVQRLFGYCRTGSLTSKDLTQMPFTRGVKFDPSTIDTTQLDSLCGIVKGDMVWRNN